MNSIDTNKIMVLIFAVVLLLLFFVSIPNANMKVMDTMIGALIGYIVGSKTN